MGHLFVGQQRLDESPMKDRLVEETLARLARAALRLDTRRFVVAGGETSGAVAGALGVSQLTIGPEITPGVPWTFATADGHKIALALKSGNCGAEDFFATLTICLSPQHERRR